jgi:hypothetical protein
MERTQRESSFERFKENSQAGETEKFNEKSEKESKSFANELKTFLCVEARTFFGCRCCCCC